MPTWYVSFEVSKPGLMKRRSLPRSTRTFETEAEAKRFAREKVDEGLIVFAGTINPHAPKQVISPTHISSWVESTRRPPADGAQD